MRFSPIVALVLLIGCTHTTEQGQQFSAEAASQIKVGVTDKSGVETLLGPPQNRTIISKLEEKWTYSYMRASGTGSAANFIPVVGMYVATNEGRSEQRSVEVLFKGNIVAKCDMATSTATVAVNLMTGSKPTSQDSVSKPCNL